MSEDDYPERLEDERLLEGLRLLLARDYFEAHEALEEPWQELERGGAYKRVLQALIQLCVSLEHLRRDNALGAFNVWQKAKQNLKGAPPIVAGVQVLGWSEEVARFFSRCELADRVRQRLEGGVAAGAEHLDADQFSPLPPLAEWPVPVLDEELSARL